MLQSMLFCPVIVVYISAEVQKASGSVARLDASVRLGIRYTCF